MSYRKYLMPSDISPSAAYGATVVDSDTGTISKQAAIDAIEKCHKRCCREDATGDEWIHYETTLNEVESIPPAQPEPHYDEWCDSCKEYDPDKHCCHRWSKVINQTVEEIRGTTAIGEWVKVHGFATPGGDPVWRCSNCGKGVHVYGIEHGTYGADIADKQWVACPNCGAIMIGERDG